MEGMIVFTQIAGDFKNTNYKNESSYQYIPNTQIVALNPNKSEKTLKVLTKDYFSACSPEISYDAKSMIFAGQKTQKDKWQIWEMNLENLKTRKITSSKENCIHPAYLPDERIVYSNLIISNNDTINKSYTLFTCNLDGSKVKQITFDPNTYFSSTVLEDGRILTISKNLYPNKKENMLMILRPDGTKKELFYKGLKIHSRGWETNNGKIVFTETNTQNKQGVNIISVNYNNPLHSKDNLTIDFKGDFYSVSPLKGNNLLVSYRLPNENHYSLYEFNIESKNLGQTIYNNKNYNVLEAVVVKKKERPKKLPSEIDTSINSGLLLCQNINFTNIDSLDNNNLNSKAVKIQIKGIDSLLGIVDVEKDGSFYLKILADTPFKIQTIDNKGNVVNTPCSWTYLRPNERRGCIGCHENNDQVPENRQPLSIRKAPIIIPTNLKGFKNEKDSLK